MGCFPKKQGIPASFTKNKLAAPVPPTIWHLPDVLGLQTPGFPTGVPFTHVQ